MGNPEPARAGQARTTVQTDRASATPQAGFAHRAPAWFVKPPDHEMKTYRETEPRFPELLVGVNLLLLFQRAWPARRQVTPKATLCNCGVHRTFWMNNSPCRPRQSHYNILSQYSIESFTFLSCSADINCIYNSSRGPAD